MNIYKMSEGESLKRFEETFLYVSHQYHESRLTIFGTYMGVGEKVEWWGGLSLMDVEF